MSLELSDLARQGQTKFTLAVATEPLDTIQLESLGLADEKPFYTIDFPYLWGRTLRTEGVIFGGGLVHLKDWRELADLDIGSGQAAELIARLEARVRALHPVLQNVRFTHRWGGPILIANEWRPVFAQHPRSRARRSSSGHSAGTAWRYRCIWDAGPPKSCAEKDAAGLGSAGKSA